MMPEAETAVSPTRRVICSMCWGFFHSAHPCGYSCAVHFPHKSIDLPRSASSADLRRTCEIFSWNAPERPQYWSRFCCEPWWHARSVEGCQMALEWLHKSLRQMVVSPTRRTASKANRGPNRFPFSAISYRIDREQSCTNLLGAKHLKRPSRTIWFETNRSISSFPLQATYHKEEREDGALYSVSLKKVRYRSSRVGGLIVNNNVEPVSHLQWETIRVRTIKAGTLEKLVEHLASQEEVEPGYLIAFLSTYRSFAMTAEVLDLLLRR